jgi:NADPH-dependent curcumin reductase CurA
MMDKSLINTQVVFVERPSGALESKHFELRCQNIPEMSDNDVLVRNIYSSVEPYLRVLMTQDMANTKRFELNTVLPARVVGEVIRSRNSQFSEGEFVFGLLRWEEYSLVVGGKGLRKIDPGLAPLSAYTGVLGPSGLTAYVGMLEIGQPTAGEAVYVSAAAGAVGQLAGQLAKLKGARVVGSAGSDEKVGFLKSELGFDDAFNYKKTSDLTATLRGLFPNGIDLSFENVGGENLDAVLASIGIQARIVLCGTVSQYDSAIPTRLNNLTSLILKQGRILGFHVRFYEHRLPDVILQMSEWLRTGKIKYREHITQGIENGPAALIGILRGENIGKQILQIGEDRFAQSVK